ncbi:MAG: mandelate racemase/muconate lactonizing enzyme family protein [Dehalococcoidia bacterium]
MKIVGIEAIPVKVPYHRPIPIAVGVNRCANNVVIKLHTDDGIVGLGEVSPLIPTYSGETQQTALCVISECLGPAILGGSILKLEEMMHRVDTAITGHLCAKAGISIALHDAAGKAMGVPVFQLLGGLYSDRIPVCFTVSWTDGSVEEAKSYVNAGFRSIKVKIGRGLRQDVKSLEQMREALGQDVPITVDANQAYSPTAAAKLVKEIEDLVEAVEQPVPRWDVDGMARVRRASRIPIIADESAPTPQDAFKIARAGAADMFLLKVMRSGGFKCAKEIVAVGQAAGMPSFPCSMTELGIGTAANIHFAASTPGLAEAFGCSFDGPLQIFGGTTTVGLQDDIVVKTPVLEDGTFEVPTGPGLGVELNEANVERYRNGEPVRVSATQVGL